MDEEWKEDGLQKVSISFDLPCRLGVVLETLRMLKNAKVFDFDNSFIDFDCREVNGGDIDMIVIHGLLK